MKWFRKKRKEEKMIIKCPACNGTGRCETDESITAVYEPCKVCMGMGVGLVSKSK